MALPPSHDHWIFEPWANLPPPPLTMELGALGGSPVTDEETAFVICCPKVTRAKIRWQKQSMPTHVRLRGCVDLLYDGIRGRYGKLEIFNTPWHWSINIVHRRTRLVGADCKETKSDKLGKIAIPHLQIGDNHSRVLPCPQLPAGGALQALDEALAWFAVELDIEFPKGRSVPPVQLFMADAEEETLDGK